MTIIERLELSTVHRQLVTDEAGRPVEVLIPCEEWLCTEKQLPGAASAREFEQPRHHEGVIRLSEDPAVYQCHLRDA